MAEYQLSSVSLQRLENVHPKLVELVHRIASLGFAVMVVTGYRNQEAQEAAVRSGHSKETWPHSMHNRVPSLAVDISPVPYDSEADKQLYFFAGFALAVAAQMGLAVRWGGDWDGAYNVYQNKFNDLYHFELKQEASFYSALQEQ